MVGGFSRCGRTVVTQDAGLGQLGVIDPQNLLPVEGIVTTVTTAGGGNMIPWFEGSIEQAVGDVTQLALPRSPGKNATLVATLTLQIPMRTAQFEAGGEMIKLRVFGATYRARKQAQQTQAHAQCETSYLRHWMSPNESLE